MAENGNGTKSIQIMFWIFAVIVFPTLFFMGSNMITNDRCRAEEDLNIRTEMKLDRQVQQKINQEILVKLTEIQVDLQYIKKGTVKIR